MADRYIVLLKQALSQVDEGYFKLETTYEPLGIVRERAFCYELYHHLRKVMGDEESLSLNGEIDKRGHPDFAEEDRRNPDFVLHSKGRHEGNTLVVEVKGRLDCGKEAIRKDLETLCIFVEKYFYRAGIFVLYNHGLEEFQERMGDVLAEMRLHPFAPRVRILAIPRARGGCEERFLCALH